MFASQNLRRIAAENGIDASSEKTPNQILDELRAKASRQIPSRLGAILAGAMNATLNPYLNFNGTTAEAMRFYQSVLGGELNIQTFGDAGMAQDEAQKNLTLHAALTSDEITLFASDGRPDTKVIFGDNVHLSLQGGDSAKLNGYFSGLAAGGQVDMPLAKQFWGDTFGMLTDKFGVHWMVNISG
jgi:PhnB protein